MPWFRSLSPVLVLAALNGACQKDPTSPISITPSAVASQPTALEFAGQSAFVEIPDAPSLDLHDTWTLEAWIRPTAPGAPTFQHILSKWNGVGDASYTLEIHEGHLRVAVHNGIDPSQAVESFGVLAPEIWQHVAATFEYGQLRLYIQGRLDRLQTGVLTPMNSTRPLSIGHEGPPFNGWQYAGIIDEVRVWRTARTARELQAASRHPLSGKKQGLVGYWRFDEGQGQIAMDSSPFGNDGRLGASPGADASDPVWTQNVAIPRH